MKHFSISSAEELSGDLTTGISAERAAEAAALNVSNIDPQYLATMADEFIKNFDRSRPTLLEKYIKQVVTDTWADHFETAHYLPLSTILRHDIAHKDYLSHLLAPSRNGEIREVASEYFALTSIIDHAHALDRLREGHRQIYDRLIRGDLRTTLRLARKPRCKIDPEGIKQMCRTHGRIFAVSTAHEKIAFVRRHSVSPLGERFAGFNVWLTAGHVVLATVAAPARILQKMWKWEAGGGGRLDDDPLLSAMVERNFVMSSTIGRVPFDVAKTTRSMLGSRGGSYRRVSQAFDHVTRATQRAAALGRGDMQRDGLSRIDFNELRLGLTATEAATYVAIELLRAFNRIDACVDAVWSGKELPEVTPRKPTANNTIFCAAVLRAEGLPDRHACAPGSVKGRTIYDLDKARNAGRPSLLSLNEKLADPEVTRNAASALGIDGAFWFTR